MVPAEPGSGDPLTSSALPAPGPTRPDERVAVPRKRERLTVLSLRVASATIHCCRREGSGVVTDSKIQMLAVHSQNFGYLLSERALPHEQLLVEFGARAELVVFSDPNSALVKARQFVETLAREMVRYLALVAPDSLQQRVKALSSAGALPAGRFADFDRIRVLGNKAVHEGF